LRHCSERPSTGDGGSRRSTPLRSGGIVAAPTTSALERSGGTRNWDYRYCWLRDATFTLLSLMSLGYYDEARSWRDWLLRAIAGSPSQIQILYGIAGERQLFEWEASWLPGYQGARPVRIGNAAVSQFQLDVHGEIADAMFQAARWRSTWPRRHRPQRRPRPRQELSERHRTAGPGNLAAVPDDDQRRQAHNGVAVGELRRGAALDGRDAHLRLELRGNLLQRRFHLLRRAGPPCPELGEQRDVVVLGVPGEPVGIVELDRAPLEQTLPAVRAGYWLADVIRRDAVRLIAMRADDLNDRRHFVTPQVAVSRADSIRNLYGRSRGCALTAVIFPGLRLDSRSTIARMIVTKRRLRACPRRFCPNVFLPC
jgi:hypothetical protein